MILISEGNIMCVRRICTKIIDLSEKMVYYSKCVEKKP